MQGEITALDLMLAALLTSIFSLATLAALIMGIVHERRAIERVRR